MFRRSAALKNREANIHDHFSASKHLEAFLEMLAAERGAAALTLSAYRTDLRDFAAFLAPLGLALEAVDREQLHAYLASPATAATLVPGFSLVSRAAASVTIPVNSGPS